MVCSIWAADHFSKVSSFVACRCRLMAIPLDHLGVVLRFLQLQLAVSREDRGAFQGQWYVSNFQRDAMG
jgi:hypothetical protein